MVQHREWTRNGLRMTDDPAQVDVAAVRGLLQQSYWGKNRTGDVIRRCVENSLCLSVFDAEQQVGFARLVTDYTTISWLCDVLVDGPHRGRGIGKWMVKTAMGLPELSGCRTILLTRDAHGLYEQYGFERCEAMWRLADDPAANEWEPEG
jgi:GNAT superfamily N-acetyltransferase